MFVHLVIWRTKPETPHAALVEAKRLLESLNGQIPGLIRIEVGINTQEGPNAGDLSLISEFESRAAFATYNAHPAHEAVKPHFAGILAERRIVDYET